jgi:hypothetical protein
VDAQRKRPMLVTAFVAIVGTAVILLNDFNPDTDPRSGGNVMAITAAAVPGRHNRDSDRIVGRLKGILGTTRIAQYGITSDAIAVDPCHGPLGAHSGIRVQRLLRARDDAEMQASPILFAPVAAAKRRRRLLSGDRSHN